MRARRPKNLQESYDRYGDWVESDPAAHRGNWRGYESGAYERIHLDLGCGKGAYTVEFASRHPDTLVVGIDSDDICIARCAELAAAGDVRNAIFLLADVNLIPLCFADGEISSISINFPTPLPRKKHAKERLVHADNLLLCRRALADGGELTFKTDSQPLFDFALSQFGLAGFDITAMSRDHDSASVGDIETLYESRARELGASICSLVAIAGAVPRDVGNDVPMSLVDYLPEDLDSMTYVPFGMEDTVFNLRNRRARQRRHENQ